MVKIKKIKIKNQKIECEIYPEDCPVPCKLVYDIKEQKQNVDFPEEYKHCTMHATMAINWIRGHITEEMPKEKIIMWY